MEKTKEAENRKLHATLENLKLPTVKMPAHQKRLRETLLNSGYFAGETPQSLTRNKINGGIRMKPKIFVIAASVALMLLTFGAYMAFFATPQVVANLALQVNPAINLRLSDRNTVVDAEGLDEQSRTLLAGLNIKGKEVQEALSIIAEALHKADFLTDERRILVALSPVGDRLGEVELQTLKGTVEEALSGYLNEHDLQVKVVSAVITDELADVVQNFNLKPEDYVDLVYEAGSEVAIQALNLGNELGIDPALFKEEFGTIAASLIDMTETGITEENALAILRSGHAADMTLEELTTITAAMIDLHEAGASQDNIMAIFKLMEAQIAAGVDRALLLEEITTITAAKIDMLDAGIPADIALNALKTALAADPTLEELTTITAAMIDLHEAGASQDNIMAIFKLMEAQIAAGVDRALLLEEITTITAAKIDMLDAGIPADIALNALKTALAADPTLEELTTITAAMIDLIEAGLSKQEALLRIQDAIAADPTLENFDDLLEDPVKQNGEDDEIIEEEPKPEDEVGDVPDVVEDEESESQNKEKQEETNDAAVTDKPDTDEAEKETDVVRGVESESQADEAKEETDDTAVTDKPEPDKPDTNQKPDDETDN